MENKNIHQGHRKRLRELVMNNGLEGMPEHQVLEYILSFVVPQKDTNVLAHNLIKKFGGFTQVLEADSSLLASVEGVGEVVAHFLANFRRMYEFYQKQRVKDFSKIKNSRDAKNYISSYLRYKLVEELYFVGLDGKNNIVTTQKIASGTVNKSSVSIRAITELVVHNKISDVVIAHNHPKGKALPSVEDDRFTRALYCAMMANGVKLVDHLIIADDNYYSYFTDGVFDKYAKEFSNFLDTNVITQDHASYEVG